MADSKLSALTQVTAADDLDILYGVDVSDTTDGVGGTSKAFPLSKVLSGRTAGGDLTGTYPNPTVAAGAVTLAKMASMATASLIYRRTAGTGAPEVNTLAQLKTDLLLTGTNSGDLQVYSGSFTRNMATASGDQAVTGVGFMPRALICINCGTTGADQASWSGMDDGSTRRCIEATTAGHTFQNSFAFIWRTALSSGNYQWGAVASFDADGFTITWTKVGSPTGTATVQYMAIR